MIQYSMLEFRGKHLNEKLKIMHKFIDGFFFSNCISLDIQHHSYVGFICTTIHLIRPMDFRNAVLIQMFKYCTLYFKITYKLQLLKMCQHL